jgi:hypothetical protein
MPVSKFLTASLGLSALGFAAMLVPSAASAAPAAAGLSSLGAVDSQLVQQVQWRGRGYYGRGYRGYYGRGGYYGPRYYGYGRGGNGAAVAAGVIGGLALGAAIAGAASAPPPPVAYAPAGGGADWIAYCSSKYRSFNPATGLYLGYDGQHHPCQ